MTLRRKLLTLILTSIFGIFAAVIVVGSIEVRRLIAEKNAEIMQMQVTQKVNALNARMTSVERAVKSLEFYLSKNVDRNRLKTDAAYQKSFSEQMIPFAIEAASVPENVMSVYFRPDPLIYGTLTGFFLIDNGQGKFTSVLPTDIFQYASNDREHVGWYYEPKEQGIPIWLEPYNNRNINVYMISYIIPIFFDGLFFGIVGMDINMATIHRVVDTIDYEDGFGFLLSKNGSLLYHREYPNGYNAVQFTDELLTASDYLLYGRKRSKEVGVYRWHGKKHYLTGMDMTNGMIMAVSVPCSDVVAPIVRLRIIMLYIFIAVIIVTALTIYFVIKHIIRPIGELTNAASRIARGELNHTVQFTSHDELGKLADSVRKMASELREYIDYIHAQAYTDAMTSVGNKTSYIDFVNLLDKKIHEGMADFVLFVFDVNGLKRINDTYGHEIGDVLISDAASVLKTVFGDEHLYRIGGDEFVVVRENFTQEDTDAAFVRFNEAVSEFNKGERPYVTELSISYGYTVFDRDGDEDFKVVFQRADGEMYKNKEKFYQGRNDRRRR